MARAGGMVPCGDLAACYRPSLINSADETEGIWHV